MPSIGSERATVQNPLVSYATDIGWAYLTPDAALTLRRGESGALFYQTLRDKLINLNPGVISVNNVDEVVSRIESVRNNIEGNAETLSWLRGERSAACGPTYVVQPTGQQAAAYQQYDPGYNPDQFLYDTALTVAILNGQRGYYGSGHVFYPYISVGGVDGYYDSGHHFHTSVTNKTVVINNYQHGRDEYVKTHPLNAKPNYTQQTTQQNQQTAKPQYTSTQNGGQGTIGRGSSAPPQRSAPSGSIGRRK